MEGCLCVTQALGRANQYPIAFWVYSNHIAVVEGLTRLETYVDVVVFGLCSLKVANSCSMRSKMGRGSELSSGDTSSRPSCNTSHRISRGSSELVASRLKPQPCHSQSDTSDCLPQTYRSSFRLFGFQIFCQR